MIIDHERTETIRRNIQRVNEHIEQAACSVGRDPSSIKLVVVTKSQPVEALRSVIEAGVRVLGENYVEEAVSKKEALGLMPGLEWHMIGHVQSRKARLVCENFSWVHSLDSRRLAEKMDRFAGERQLRIPVLLECNLSGEDTKSGWPAWEKEKRSEIIREFAQILNLPNLDVRGLMTMAPFFSEPEPARPYFRGLRLLRDELITHLPHGNWNELSMGMSGDFMVAIQEGATLVRIGTAIMGARN